MSVLVGYLPSAEGEAAWEAGLAEAVRREEDLVVVNSPRSGAAVSAAAAADAELAGLRERAAELGVALDVRRRPHEGDLVEDLLELAEEVDASVLVIGLRRRSAVGKFLMGSTAQQILLQSDRPVLAVKPRS